ncbi:E3 ubiquitin-protein ligase TRIM39-like [Pristis pectinata]|uniref:E3 ubiquitin-protein ligase TRIM39-like n=1 Tax=Pristis pectinata TaxID=685728 RepID=UPI00223E211B|nr:E3 ubiquitin-protein ligase TRIM39-like [Pristis pectinata]
MLPDPPSSSSSTFLAPDSSICSILCISFQAWSLSVEPQASLAIRPVECLSDPSLMWKWPRYLLSGHLQQNNIDSLCGVCCVVGNRGTAEIQQLPESERTVNQEVRGVNMASKGQVESLTEEVICPICLDFFTDPVILECGHNFCRSCITRCWEREERNSCPECRAEFVDRTLRVNRALASLSEKARKLNLNPIKKERKLHCEEHQEELKLFCETDKKLICVICRDAREHREHRFLPVKEAVEICKDQIKSSLESLTKMKSDFQEMERQQKEKISGVREQSHSLQSHITSQFAELHQILTEKEQRLLRDLREEEEKILNPMEKKLQEIQENLNSIQEKLSKLQERMNEEDSLIFLKEEARRKRRINDDVQTLSVTDGALPVEKFDHLFLLKTALREMFDTIKRVSVTLDVGTAGPRLEVSEDRKSVRRTRTWRSLPDTGKRFTVGARVLGSEGFTSGGHYWEVEVAGSRGWGLGVAAKSVERKRRVGLIPENGFWTIEGDGDEFYVNTSPRSRLPAGPIPGRVGVYLGYGSGTVSFYSADTKSHLHTFTGNKFTEKLYPFFGTWDENWLRICSGSAPGL